MVKVLVVGTGVAGITAALAVKDKYQVTVLTKSTVGSGSTEMAQGGIAAEISEPQEAIVHAEDTLEVSAGLGDANAVRSMCLEAAAHIRRLQALGVKFDVENGQLALGLEAAHSKPRILHAGGDQTGRAIQDALSTALRKAVDQGEITLLENHMLLDLQLNSGVVAGASVMPTDGHVDQAFNVEADVVILATGGAGQLYSHNTNAIGSTGDGIAAAFRAGAELADLEFYQFHPTYTAGKAAKPGILISEAVRGAGGYLVNDAGERFMLDAHAQADLAPRDVVARSIAAEMSLQPGKPILLDVSSVGRAPDLARMFPSINGATRALGYDWAKEPIPVSPAAHYWMGGILTDLHARTSIPGLFAAGEAACTGVHGANRLASNSLLEGLVYGQRAAFAISSGRWREAAQTEGTVPHHYVTIPTLDASFKTRHAAWSESLEAVETVEASFSRAALQDLMWSAAGVFRQGSTLRVASHQLDRWRFDFPLPKTTHQVEDLNLIDLARGLVQAAMARPEARGAHYRMDHPHMSKYYAHRFVCVTERTFRAH